MFNKFIKIITILLLSVQISVTSLVGECNVCFANSKIACLDENHFSTCFEGLPTTTITKCPGTRVCTDNVLICRSTEEGFTPSCYHDYCGDCSVSNGVFTCLDETTYGYCFGNTTPLPGTLRSCPQGFVCNYNSREVCVPEDTNQPSCKSKTTTEPRTTTDISTISTESTTGSTTTEITTESTTTSSTSTEEETESTTDSTTQTTTTQMLTTETTTQTPTTKTTTTTELSTITTELSTITTESTKQTPTTETTKTTEVPTTETSTTTEIPTTQTTTTTEIPTTQTTTTTEISTTEITASTEKSTTQTPTTTEISTTETSTTAGIPTTETTAQTTTTTSAPRDPRTICEEIGQQGYFKSDDPTCREYVYCYLLSGQYLGWFYYCDGYFNAETRKCQKERPLDCVAYEY